MFGNNQDVKTQIEIFIPPRDSEVTNKRGILFRSVTVKILQNRLAQLLKQRSLRIELTGLEREATAENIIDLTHNGTLRAESPSI